TACPAPAKEPATIYGGKSPPGRSPVRCRRRHPKGLRAGTDLPHAQRPVGASDGDAPTARAQRHGRRPGGPGAELLLAVGQIPDEQLPDRPGRAGPGEGGDPLAVAARGDSPRPPRLPPGETRLAAGAGVPGPEAIAPGEEEPAVRAEGHAVGRERHAERLLARGDVPDPPFGAPPSPAPAPRVLLDRGQPLAVGAEGGG